MANPPFNVDEVDADKVKNDPRLPFGLPGVNKKNTVSNGNYLWISYFYSYLNKQGRAGFVMSSQASSAGRDEALVRCKLVETGAVDVMIAIRSNFFYTRTVPCELWFFDKNKPERLRDKVLMIDARNIYRKVTRKIYDFSPEQLQNLTAIVWLYRGKTEKFLGLVTDYLDAISKECVVIPDKLTQFETTLHQLQGKLAGLSNGSATTDLARALTELQDAEKLYESDRTLLVREIEQYRKKFVATLPTSNKEQHTARKAFDPIAEHLKGLSKQIDLLYKLAVRLVDLHAESFGSVCPERSDSEVEGRTEANLNRRAITQLLKQLDEARKDATEQLKQAVYFHRQLVWLHDRFPDAKLQAVSGLVKLVDRKELEATESWSLTPGRYVGVAPPEEDEDFDFEETLRDIHVELASLNEEAAELVKKIQENFVGLGV